MRNAKKLLKYTVTLFVATSGLIMGLGSVATASTGTGGASMVGQAGPLVKPILQPLLDRVSAKLDNLTQVSATGTVMFRKPTGGQVANLVPLCRRYLACRRRNGQFGSRKWWCRCDLDDCP
jgi:hypothetical protein